MCHQLRGDVLTAFYNEIDPAAAALLRNLISAGHIAPGIVDERSIEDVRPNELVGYTQCHFFAGIGIWSLALRQAGWPDDKPAFTMSCPCQPFSKAGKGAGFADERHLWPAAFHIVSQCQPEYIFGEQVASRDAEPWLDLVQADLEALGYSFGAVPIPASGFGAPHIRDRLYWMANAKSVGRANGEAVTRGCGSVSGATESPFGAGNRRSSGGLGNASSKGLAQRIGHTGVSGGQAGGTQGQAVERAGVHASGLADTERQRICAHGQGCTACTAGTVQSSDGQRERLWAEPGAGGDGVGSRPGPVNGYWTDADWLFCRDGKWRPAQPGIEPLAYGLPRSLGNLSPELQGLAELAGLDAPSLKRAKQYRVQQLKGYGNAIVAPAAEAFVRACMDARGF